MIKTDNKTKKKVINVTPDKFLDGLKDKIGAKKVEDYDKGIRKNVNNYIRKKISQKKGDNKNIGNRKNYMSDIADYLEKTEHDYSAKDLTDIILNRDDMPPIQYMSSDSLDKKIGRILDTEYKDEVYYKKASNGYARCVNDTVKDKIINHPAVKKLVKKQIARAERHYSNTPEYRWYKTAKRLIKGLEEELDRSGDDDYREEIPLRELVSNTEAIVSNRLPEIYQMVKAVYSLLFTEFDLTAYNKDYEEILRLQEDRCVDERYKELYGILSSRNYEEKYYRYSPDSKLLDILADKVVERLKKAETENDQ